MLGTRYARILRRPGTARLFLPTLVAFTGILPCLATHWS